MGNTQCLHSLGLQKCVREQRRQDVRSHIEPTRSLLNTLKVIEALQWVADLHLVHNVAHFDSGNYSAELPKGIYA